jgi:hypothetical protein
MTNAHMLVQFVSTMDAATALVRHDVNESDSVYMAGDGFSLGTPTRQGDPDAFQPEWRFRQIQFTQVVEGLKADVFPVLARLERECLRPKNIFRVQASPGTKALYVQTYASPISPIPWEEFWAADDTKVGLWEVQVTLDADPWLLGEEITETVVIASTTGAGTNRQQVALPAIEGDVGTPVTVTFPTGGVGENATGPWFVSLAPQDTPTLNRWAVTVAGSSTLVSAPAAIAPGRYQVFAFVPSGSPALRFGWSSDGVNTKWNDDGVVLGYQPLETPGGSLMNVQDLGEVTFVGAPGATGTFTPKINVIRTSGAAPTTATLMLVTISDDRIDEDAAVAKPTLPAGIVSQGRLWLGSDDVQAIVYTVSGDTFSTGVVPDGASRLVAYPQHDNILTVIPTSASATYTVQVKYRERRRQLPGG